MPWTVSIEGTVDKPRVLDLDRILKLAPLEERVYRHRCVEGWSMVVPWIGFPLKALIQSVNPTSNTKCLTFESLYDPKQMPTAPYLYRHFIPLPGGSPNGRGDAPLSSALCRPL
jgi:sulfoxide reductase catalytic subunit YedY